MAKERAGAVVVQAGIFFQNAIADLAIKYRLPSASVLRPFVDAGGLLSYGADLSHMYRRSAVFVSKILQGTKPADLPIEQPTKFELVINLKTAKALGLTIPPSVLARADEVIQWLHPSGSTPYGFGLVSGLLTTQAWLDTCEQFLG
jgi:putative ABC transport system substrate-binding protein